MAVFVLNTFEIFDLKSLDRFFFLYYKIVLSDFYPVLFIVYDIQIYKHLYYIKFTLWFHTISIFTRREKKTKNVEVLNGFIWWKRQLSVTGHKWIQSNSKSTVLRLIQIFMKTSDHLTQISLIILALRCKFRCSFVEAFYLSATQECPAKMQSRLCECQRWSVFARRAYNLDGFTVPRFLWSSGLY